MTDDYSFYIYRFHTKSYPDCAVNFFRRNLFLQSPEIWQFRGKIANIAKITSLEVGKFIFVKGSDFYLLNCKGSEVYHNLYGICWLVYRKSQFLYDKEVTRKTWEKVLESSYVFTGTTLLPYAEICQNFRLLLLAHF